MTHDDHPLNDLLFADLLKARRRFYLADPFKLTFYPVDPPRPQHPFKRAGIGWDLADGSRWTYCDVTSHADNKTTFIACEILEPDHGRGNWNFVSRSFLR